MRDARRALRRKIQQEGWTLHSAAKNTSPRVTGEALRLFLDGRRPGWKVATAVASLLGCEPGDVLGGRRA